MTIFDLFNSLTPGGALAIREQWYWVYPSQVCQFVYNPYSGSFGFNTMQQKAPNWLADWLAPWMIKCFIIPAKLPTAISLLWSLYTVVEQCYLRVLWYYCIIWALVWYNYIIQAFVYVSNNKMYLFKFIRESLTQHIEFSHHHSDVVWLCWYTFTTQSSSVTLSTTTTYLPLVSTCAGDSRSRLL